MPIPLFSSGSKGHMGQNRDAENSLGFLRPMMGVLASFDLLKLIFPSIRMDSG
jgi:hypothetical protein